MKKQVKKEVRKQMIGIRKSFMTFARAEVMKKVGKCNTALTHQMPSSDKMHKLNSATSVLATIYRPRKARIQ